MRSLFAFISIMAACAAQQTPSARPPLALAATCAHAMPADECVTCDASRAAAYKERGDWCKEHELPESHCLACHPALKFYVIPPLPAGADLVHVSTMGEDVPSLEPHVAPGKVTVFDFYAHWCGPCKEVDALVHTVMGQRTDVAYRKLNVYEWDSPLAKRYLANVPQLPYLVVYDSSGKKHGEVRGIDVDALAALLETAR